MALRDVGAGKADYVQLSIDVKKETVNLESKASSLQVSMLPKKVPTDQPRYHVYLFKHSHQGNYLESIGELVIIKAI